MNIPLTEWNPCADRVSKGEDGKRHADWYKTGLLNALIHFRPRVCLEIGTNKGGTTAVFERYFSLWREDGMLVTVDIEKFVDVSSKRVKQVVKMDGVDGEMWTEELYDVCDFAFIDGDHSEDGVLNDVTKVKELHIPIIVFDDCRGEWPAPTKWFSEFDGEKYDFNDWPVYIGMGVCKI